MDHDAILLRFDPETPFERAVTPPSAWYTSPEWHEYEQARIFRHEWIAVARAEPLAAPGSFVTGELAGQPWIVVRAEDGVLRAFHNVCRHHATAVARGAGTCAELVCPYHGWTYGLDGALVRAPRLGKVEGFSRADFGLAPVHVATWGPLVFISFAPNPRDLAADLVPLDDRLSAGDLALLSFVERRSYRIASNWKVFCDNYLDGGYHVPHMHPALAEKLDLDAYRVELFERLSIQSAIGRGDERVGERALYAFVHPNLMINRYGPWLDVDVVLPIDAHTCEVVIEWWLDPAAGFDAIEIRGQIDESEQVQHEDVTVCELVQRGLRSISYDVGRYAGPERAMHAFHRSLAQRMIPCFDPASERRPVHHASRSHHEEAAG